MTHAELVPASPLTFTVDGGYDEYDNDAYLLRFWLPIIGADAIALRAVVLDEIDREGAHAWPTTVDEIAHRLNLGTHIVPRLLWRTRRHGFWTHEDIFGECTWTIPRLVPLLGDDELRRRTETFRAAHAAFTGA